MPADLDRIRAARFRALAIPFGGETLNFTYSVDAFARAQGEFGADHPVAPSRLDAMVALLDGVIASWDLEHMGRPVPCDAIGFNQIGIVLCQDIFRAIMADIGDRMRASVTAVRAETTRIVETVASARAALDDRATLLALVDGRADVDQVLAAIRERVGPAEENPAVAAYQRAAELDPVA